MSPRLLRLLGGSWQSSSSSREPCREIRRHPPGGSRPGQPGRRPLAPAIAGFV